ncbi:MAG: hypothetical protein HFI38_07760 [Lachnospiraceae bacterium]|jgi:uncharacterized membrane protein|nr:hypothetical protein [Lachnospiraceae bacterium]
MTRHEFTGHLREALSGEIPDAVVEENVRYYNGYITDELKKGRSEEDIFAELGDPRLIAKTIMETWQSDDTSFQDDRGGYGNPRDDDGRMNRSAYGDPYGSDGGRKGTVNRWYVRVIPLVVILLVLFFVFWVVSGVLHLTFSILFSKAFWVILAAALLIHYLGRKR